MALDIYSRSAKNPRKALTAEPGDAFAVLHLEDRGFILLAVSDGVSGAPCDWLASRVACETVLEKFAQAPSAEPDHVGKLVTHAHRAVQTNPTAGCRGMLSSLSLLVLDLNEEIVTIANVGDSAILIGPENDLRQVTKDDVEYVPVMRGGKPLLRQGVPVFARGVTKSLGQEGDLEVEVTQAAFGPADVIALVSDGVSKDDSFASTLAEALASGEWERRLDEMVAACAQESEDDATLVVVRRRGIDDASRDLFEEALKTGMPWDDVSPSKSVARMSAERLLFEAFDADDDERIDRILDYCLANRIAFSFEFLEGFNSRVFRQGRNRNLLMRLQGLMRAARSSQS